jgi:hypothetical protein
MAFIGRMLRARARNSAAAPELALTQETSGLSGRQLAAGVKALQVLHLDERHNQLLPSDVLCFLRAVGLVSRALMRCKPTDFHTDLRGDPTRIAWLLPWNPKS